MFYGLCRRGAEEGLRLATLGAGGVRALLFFGPGEPKESNHLFFT